MSFLISQFIFQKYLKQVDSTYAFVIGLVIYSALYLYFLFYNTELLPFYNNILIYVISLDLLLTAFYSYTYTSRKFTTLSDLEQNQENNDNDDIDPSEHDDVSIVYDNVSESECEDDNRDDDEDENHQEEYYPELQQELEEIQLEIIPDDILLSKEYRAIDYQGQGQIQEDVIELPEPEIKKRGRPKKDAL
jgi:hypothetical protein